MGSSRPAIASASTSLRSSNDSFATIASGHPHHLSRGILRAIAPRRSKGDSSLRDPPAAYVSARISGHASLSLTQLKHACLAIDLGQPWGYRSANISPAWHRIDSTAQPQAADSTAQCGLSPSRRLWRVVRTRSVPATPAVPRHSGGSRNPGKVGEAKMVLPWWAGGSRHE